MQPNLEVKTIARTLDAWKVEEKPEDSLFVLGGKMAGVCYMKDNYLTEVIQDIEKAEKRAEKVCASGHHSVFEHGNVTLQLQGIPKIMAMILNSTEQYATSEKSARYTIMEPLTKEEEAAYKKWTEIFDYLIGEKYPEITKVNRKKLAIENARYMLSVLTPTVMMWTTNYRQLAYVISWLNDLGIKCEHLSKSENDFNERLAYWCKTLSSHLSMESDGYKHIQNKNDRVIEFMAFQQHIYNPGILSINDLVPEETIGDTYQVVYDVSFAALAQLQRSRTIHYEMLFSGYDADEFGVYVPKIIRGTHLEAEWLKDFKTVAFNYPQCTMVKVIEQGRAVKFFDQCRERVCGRAQLETMENRRDMLKKFVENIDNFSNIPKIKLVDLSVDKKLARNCKEPCIWGCKRALTRSI